MYFKLTSSGWIRVGISIVLVGLAAFCFLQSVINGFAYGDLVGLPDRVSDLLEYQHRARLYLWTCIALQGLTTLILAPALSSPGVSQGNAGVSRKPVNYAAALCASVLGTGLFFLVFFWLVRLTK
jgi:hypothetical protein